MAKLAVFGFSYTSYSAVNLVVDPSQFVTWVVSPDADEDKIRAFLEATTPKRKVLLLATAPCIRLVPKAFRSKALLAVFDTPEKLLEVAKKVDVTFMDFEIKSGSVISQKRVVPSTINTMFGATGVRDQEEGMPSVDIEVFRGASAVSSFRHGVAVAIANMPKDKHESAIKTFAKLLIGFTKFQDYTAERTSIIADGADRVEVMNIQRWIQQHAPLLAFQKICKGATVEDALAETKEGKHAKDLEFVMAILPPKKGLKFAVNRRKKAKAPKSDSFKKAPKGKGKGKRKSKTK